MIRNPRSLPAWAKDECGSGAVEFVLVLPIAILLTIGAIYLSMMLFATSSLHFAVEDTARCLSIKKTVCTNASSAQTYALTRYAGPKFTPALAASDFVVTTGTNCGNKVEVINKPFALRTGFRTLSVNISARSCFPT